MSAALRGWATELWRGLSNPSLPGLLGTVAVAGGLWIGAAATIGPQLVADRTMVVAHDDDFAEVGGEVLHQALRGAVGTDAVVLLGTSASREAISSREQFARALRRHLADPEVVLLTAAALTPLEMLGLADRLPPGMSGIALIEISERNLAVPLEEHAEILRHPRLPFTSATQRLAAQALGLPVARRPIGNYFVDNAEFFLARPQALGVLLGRPPVHHLHHQIDQVPDPSEADWARMLERLRTWLQADPKVVEGNAMLYRLTVERLAEWGLTPVLVEAPRSPELWQRAVLDPELARLLQQNSTRSQALADHLNVPLWDPGAQSGLLAESFKDYTHLSERMARERFTERLADSIGTHLAEAGARP